MTHDDLTAAASGRRLPFSIIASLAYCYNQYVNLILP